MSKKSSTKASVAIDVSFCVMEALVKETVRVLVSKEKTCITKEHIQEALNRLGGNFARFSFLDIMKPLDKYENEYLNAYLVGNPHVDKDKKEMVKELLTQDYVQGKSERDSEKYSNNQYLSGDDIEKYVGSFMKKRSEKPAKYRILLEDDKKRSRSFKSKKRTIKTEKSPIRVKKERQDASDSQEEGDHSGAKLVAKVKKEPETPSSSPAKKIKKEKDELPTEKKELKNSASASASGSSSSKSEKKKENGTTSKTIPSHAGKTLKTDAPRSTPQKGKKNNNSTPSEEVRPAKKATASSSTKSPASSKKIKSAKYVESDHPSEEEEDEINSEDERVIADTKKRTSGK